MNNFQTNQLYLGVIEDRNDPLMVGRVKVRVVGLHNPNKIALPTDDLPWALIMQPAHGGTGAPFVGPAEGSTVLIMFNDHPKCQQPIVIGCIAGIPQGDPVIYDEFEQSPILKDEIAPQGRELPTTVAQSTANHIGPLTSDIPEILTALVNHASTNSDTPKSILDSLLIPSALSMGSIGGLTSSAIQLGSSNSDTLNNLENTLINTGNFDEAINSFANSFLSSSDLGGLAADLLNGNISLASLAEDFDAGVSDILQSMQNNLLLGISNAVDPSILRIIDIFRTLDNIDNFSIIEDELNSLNLSPELFSLISTVKDKIENGLFVSIDELIDFINTSANVIQSISSGVTDTNQDIIDFNNLYSNVIVGPMIDEGFPAQEILPFVNPLASSFENSISDLTNFSSNSFISNLTNRLTNQISSASSLGNLLLGLSQDFANVLNSSINNGSIEETISQVFNTDISTINSSDLFFANSENVANTITGLYSTGTVTDSGSSGMSLISGQTSETVKGLSSSQFLLEGSTPPTRGIYGGPNFAGADPVILTPSVDMTLYEGGSEKGINATVPSNYRGNSSEANTNIQIILSACDKYGLTTNEQKASILAIIGGESGWIPKEESAQYSNPKRLCQIFQSTFKGNLKLAEECSNWIGGNKGTKAEFFNIVYDPANNGRSLGNHLPGDGGRFFGRGFLQITGRANYERYATLSGYDIIKNPDLLITDKQVSAEVAVIYFLDRVKHVTPTAHPNYFYAAKKAVGNNSPDIAAKKLSYYEHFYQIKTPESYAYTKKDAGNVVNNHSYFGSLGRNTDLDYNIGFHDPHNKYPLKRYLNEPETSRLARGVIKETIVQLKESQRLIDVPIAIDGKTWSQPSVPYGAKYPYNHVEESESGHFREVDDTPGYERLHTYHKSGTFEEIDVNGTKVTKIVGDNYTILDRNGYISISGDANLTVSGNVNIFCQSDANIEVSGSAEMKVGGSFDVGVARDMNIAVQGDFSVWANGKMNLQSKLNSHIRSDSKLHLSSNGDMNILSQKNMNIETRENHSNVCLQNMNTDCRQIYDLSAGNTMRLDAIENMFLKSGTETNIESGSVLNLSTRDDVGGLSGDVNIDGNNVWLNSGKTSSIPRTVRSDGIGFTEDLSYYELYNKYIGGQYTFEKALKTDLPYSGVFSRITDNAKPAIKSLYNGMIPPPKGTPLYNFYEPLVSPPLLGSDKYLYELPDEGQTLASKIHIKDMIAQNGKSNTFESLKATATKSSSSTETIPPTISSVGNYSSDYKLSRHFTLGMMFDGGFNVRHKLISQNGLSVDEIVENLSSLCNNILEKYLEVLPEGIQGYNKYWTITSGYRMGTNTSDHTRGCACDISLLGGSDMREAHFELIQELEKIVSYDQLILEYKGHSTTWIHTGFRGDGSVNGARSSNRFQSFTMVNHKTYNNSEFVLVA